LRALRKNRVLEAKSRVLGVGKDDNNLVDVAWGVLRVGVK
jgi:hypothetical protein